ncbi:thiol-disulfide oxidoreductase DCC [Haloferax elongans ATCC BAA-1513]|uniref:Thiol-disulfide oxidoreductase DCC n=1 Tax=Haloferax elongans ATCC BAA-1513 TaxID=1230453 RepID=M0HY38_HALEO|nr:thiol-disulfide oxidoreductase DCC family protein [Haloferax elongans]ELZ89495.1 thiol-disulfide oxidoreductase DCC [Haloferax elongans ATCC BAA-1513]
MSNSGSDAHKDIDAPIVLFDGVCNLCNGFVQFLIENDEDANLRFASLQSEVGQELLRSIDLPDDKNDSIVLIEDETYYEKSDAALAIAGYLDGLYGHAPYLRFIPQSIRDRVYMLVANNRYSIFGKQDRCMMPTPDRQGRFLSSSDI